TPSRCSRSTLCSPASSSGAGCSYGCEDDLVDGGGHAGVFELCPEQADLLPGSQRLHSLPAGPAKVAPAASARHAQRRLEREPEHEPEHNEERYVSKQLKRAAFGLVALILLIPAGTFLYIHFVEPKAPARLSLSATASGSSGSTSGTAAAAGGLTGTWRPTGGSQVGYRVKGGL